MLSPAEIEGLLARTSRTFALAIPLLPPPLDRQVGIAYLLFRIADTLEDATRWPRDARLAALASFEAWLAAGDHGPPPSATPGAPASTRAPWQHRAAETPPVDDGGYLDLLTRADAVRATLDAGEPGAITRRHVLRTSAGMRAFVATQDAGGRLELPNVEALQRYCYVVAGIVGEMLTELFVAADPHARASAAELRMNAAAFGEGLQLVNVLKDAASDARDGRVYLPNDCGRAEIFALARRDLDAAEAYVAALAGCAPGVIAFCELPVRLARATLDRLEAGASKLPRDETARIVADVVARSRDLTARRC